MREKRGVGELRRRERWSEVERSHLRKRESERVKREGLMMDR